MSWRLQGTFSFNLPPGTYQLRQVLPQGWRSSTPDPLVVTVTGGSTTQTLFGSYSVFGQVRGTLYDDANLNGVRDTGEAGFVSRTVYLDVNNNDVVDSGDRSTTTDAAGDYSFTNVAPGTYFVRVDPGNVVSPPTRRRQVDVADDQVVTGADFGYSSTAQFVRGRVFTDVDGDGRLDPGEAIIGGHTVRLYNGYPQLKTLVGTTVTDAQGHFGFAPIAPSEVYRLEADPIPGFLTTGATSFQRWRGRVRGPRHRLP